MSIYNIKKMPKNKFVGIIQKAIQRRAFEQLMFKQGIKGLEIRYTELKLSIFTIVNFGMIKLETNT